MDKPFDQKKRTQKKDKKITENINPLKENKGRIEHITVIINTGPQYVHRKNNNISLNTYEDVLLSPVDNTYQIETVNTKKQLYTHRLKIKINNRTKIKTIVKGNNNKSDNNDRTN